MKAGDIVRRKSADKIFVGSYYYVLQVGANYMCALKLNSDDNKHHYLIKRDFCKISTAKIRVKNKTYNDIESLENNTCKTIKHVLSKQWENVIGSWGNNTTQPKLTFVSGSTYKLEIPNSIYQFYGVDTSKNITAINIVFRNADGKQQTVNRQQKVDI